MASGGDGSVEILVTGTVDASVAAAAKEATATFDAVGAKAAEATAAQQARISAMVDRSIADMEAKADAAKSAMAASGTLGIAGGGTGERDIVAAQNAQMELGASGTIALDAVAAKTAEATVATGGLKMATSGAIQEYIRLGHEAMMGNFSRMPGSLIVLASRTGGLQTAFEFLTPAVIVAGSVIAVVAGGIIAAAIAADQGASEVAKFNNAMAATAGYAGVTISQLQEMSAKMATFGHETIGTATEQMMKLAGSGKFTGQTLLLVGEDSARMAALTGENAVKFQEQFGRMGEGVAKFAKEYQDQFHQITTAQYTYIRQLEEQGDKEGAEQALAKDVYDYLGTQAPQNLGYLERAWHGVEAAISGAWDALKGFGRDSADDQIGRINAQISAIKADDNSPLNIGGNARGNAQIASLEKQKTAIEATEKAQRNVAAATAASAKAQTDGVDAASKLAAKFEESKTSGEKLHKAIKDINDEAAKATAADPAHAAMYAEQAAAAISQAKKSDTPHEKKGPKGPSETSDWTEQLHAQEVASGEFFKDQTATELAFWQSKLAIVKVGSKEYNEVQSHIYEASKTLAHQAYAEQIANDNEKIAADKDNWSAEQADWDAKIAYIKGKFGEESAEYHNAYREEEAAQREHTKTELRDQEEAGKKSLDATKRLIDDQKRISEETAKISILQIKDKAEGSPFGGVSEAKAESATKQSAISDEMAGLAKLQSATDKMYADDMAQATKAGALGKDAWQKANDAKIASDADFTAKQKALIDKQTEQTLAGIAAQKAAYSSYISGTVSTTISGFDKMISGQMTWRNLGISIYGSVVREAEQQVEKMATKWITEHIFMTAAERAELAAQKAAHVAAQAAKTAATTTSVAAQTTATTAGGATQTAAMMATTKAQVALLAGLAGAGGVASMAAAPWPLDMTAPAFGAEMAAAAMSMGAFAQGTNVVPNDMIAQIHAGERIVPKADNDTMMSMMARGSGGGANGGDTHNHFAPTVHANGVDGKAVMSALENNFSDFTGLLKRAHRNGAFR